MIGVAVAAAVAGYVLYTHDPSAASFYPPCVFHLLTGLQCPGCGGTRALHHLLHGRLAEAFRYNAMLLVFGPVLLAGVVVELRNARPGAAGPRLIHRPWVAWTAIAVLLGWGVLRNLG